MDTIKNGISSWISEVESRLAGMGTAGVILGAVWNLFVCFFGYRFYRVVITICGFLFGALVSYFLIGKYAAIDQTVLLILALAIGVVVALIAYVLYRAGIFLLVAAAMFFILSGLMSVTAANQNMVFLISGIIALVCAILSVKFMKQIMIFSSGLAGGFGTVKIIGTVLGLSSQMALTAVSLILAAAGIWFQLRNDAKLS